MVTAAAGFIHPDQSRPAASGQPTPWGDAPQLEHNDQQPLLRGKETQPGSLHGFQTNLSDAFVQLPAGAHIQVALISLTRFEQLATATGDHQALEVIHRSNSANLHPQRFAEIISLIEGQLMGGGQEDLMGWD